MNYKEFAIKTIKSCKGRLTKTQIAVIDTLNVSNVMLTPQEIANQINTSSQSIDVVTVYRILDKFESLGIVHKHQNAYSKCRKPSCQNSKHCHHQFVCLKCEHVSEIHIDDQDFIKEIAAKFFNLKITTHNFEFSGLCLNCNQ